MIELATVVFNHDSSASLADGLNIRIDRQQPAADWVHGATSPSVAAYTLAPNAGRPLTIVARFTFPASLPLPPGANSVMVRAQPTSADAPLGPVDPTKVPLPALSLTTAAVSMTLSNAAIWTAGVGRYDMSWIWQVQLTPDSAWLDFDRSDHIVYVTLDAPGAPWSQATDAPHQPLWPWTTALDLACKWARGVKLTGTLAAARGRAAMKIEDAIYGLGERPTLTVKYQGTPEWVIEAQTGSVFKFTDFLAFVNGSVPSDKIAAMNCTDCSTAVATFANLLGCNLGLRHISPKASDRFHTNTVVTIGAGSGNADVQFFAYHEVAVRPGSTRTTDHVHDACLKIDRDGNPLSGANGDYALAKGLARGAFAKAKAKKYKYVHRLIASGEVGTCKDEALEIPDLDTVVGIPVISVPIQNLWNQYLQQIAHLAPLPDVEVQIAARLDPFVLPGLHAYKRVLNPEHLARLGNLVTASADFYYVETGRAHSRGRQRDRRLRLSVAYAPTAQRARQVLAWLLTRSSAPHRAIRHGMDGFTGDVAFLARDNGAEVGIRGTAVVRVMSIGRDAVALAPVLAAATEALRVAG